MGAWSVAAIAAIAAMSVMSFMRRIWALVAGVFESVAMLLGHQHHAPTSQRRGYGKEDDTMAGYVWKIFHSKDPKFQVSIFKL